MVASLSCVPQNNLDPKSFGKLFNNICGQSGNPCAGISSNVSTGVYGAYSMCDAKSQLAYVLDTYYQSQGNSKSACDWDGQARVVTPQSTNDNCKAILSSASASNSFAATATAAATSSNVAVPIPMKNLFTIGDFAIGLYVVVAMIGGAAMVML